MDEVDEVAFVLGLAIVCCTTFLALLEKNEEAKRQKRRRSVWMREILKLREKEGAYKLLLPKLLCDGPFYKNFLRTSKASFELLLTLIEKDIQPLNTVLRSGISAGERLAVTLRYQVCQ